MTEAERIADSLSQEAKYVLVVMSMFPECLPTADGSEPKGVSVDRILGGVQIYLALQPRIAILEAENARLRGPWKYDPTNNTYTANVTKEN